MATTSIWSVKGWLGKLVVYVENPDKTENPKFFEKQNMTAMQMQGLSLVDGIRYYRSEKDYYNMQMESDKLCREYGLSVIENPKRGKSKHYGEWRAEQEQRPTWRGLIRADIDTALRQSMTERQFFDALKKQGYEIKIGKDISVRPPKKERLFRLQRNFGEDYSIEGIRKQILAQSRPERPLPEMPYKTKTYRVKGNPKTAKKLTGFRALYIHYCYLLGVFPKDRPQSKRRLHFLLREDLMKLGNISEEARLLGVHHIDTAEQLSSYKAALKTEIKTLSDHRKQLYKKSHTKAVVSDEVRLSEVKGEISTLSRWLNTLRREVHLCEDIAVRSGVITYKIKTIREDGQSKGKEKINNEQFRRCSRTNR